MLHSPPRRGRRRGVLPSRLVVLGAAMLAIVAGPVPPAGATPAAARVPVPVDQGVAAVIVAAQPTLRLGSRGTAVVQLQRRLVALHYDVGPVDGIFGSSTYHGVVAFQKVNRLVRDGIVGPRTWAALAQPVVPRPRYRSSGYALEVNIARQVVYLTYQGRMVRILDSSTGKASTPTPTGSFRVLRRIDGWRRSPLGLMWRPNYFYGGYAVHGSTSVPAYPASHGCVRVTVPAMNRMWSKLRIGMPVWVYR